MTLLQRVSRLLKANVNHLLDNAEDPELMIKQLILEMDESIADLRRETVNAVARQKHLERKVEEAERQAADLESKAELALNENDESLARQVLGRKIEALRRRDTLADELTSATDLATRVKRDLRRMQEQAAVARRKKDELIRRKRSAEARLKAQQAARRSSEAVRDASGRAGDLAGSVGELGGFADEIQELEARAEASRELAEDERDDSEERVRAMVDSSNVDAELDRLKRKRARSA